MIFRYDSDKRNDLSLLDICSDKNEVHLPQNGSNVNGESNGKNKLINLFSTKRTQIETLCKDQIILLALIALTSFVKRVFFINVQINSTMSDKDYQLRVHIYESNCKYQHKYQHLVETHLLSGITQFLNQTSNVDQIIEHITSSLLLSQESKLNPSQRPISKTFVEIDELVLFQTDNLGWRDIHLLLGTNHRSNLAVMVNIFNTLIKKGGK